MLQPQTSMIQPSAGCTDQDYWEHVFDIQTIKMNMDLNLEPCS